MKATPNVFFILQFGFQFIFIQSCIFGRK